MAPMDTAAGLLAFSQRQLDRLISPETRSRVVDRVQAFAAARPLLFTFIVAQVLTSLLPIALFLAFTSSILALSVGAALLFSLFWLGVALLFLIPALFVTISLGFLVFLWAVAARFAWFALPSRIKSSITAGSRTFGSNEQKNGHRGSRYPSYAAIASAAPGKDVDMDADTNTAPRNASHRSASSAKTNGESGDGAHRAKDVGVADLQKFKEDKEGTITP